MKEKSFQYGEQGKPPDLLINQAYIRPYALAVVQVSQRISRQISSGQDDWVFGEGGQKLPAEPLHHSVPTLITLPKIISTYASNYSTLASKQKLHFLPF